MSTTASDSTERPLPSDVVIGIPAYNEADTVGGIVRAAKETTAAVVVVDDGSDDDTAAAAAAAGATVLRHEENRGYGAALNTLFRSAHDDDVDHLVVVDADGQHDPTEALDLVAAQRASGGDIVVGSRLVAESSTEMPLYRRVGLATINGLTAAALKLGYSSEPVADTQSGFRAYNSRAIELLACRAELSDGMDASLDILFHAADAGCTVTETPVDVRYDVSEANTHNPVVHGMVLVRNVLGRVLTDRPARVLSVPGAVCLLLVGVFSQLSSGSSALLSATVPALITLAVLTGAAVAVGHRSPGRE